MSLSVDLDETYTIYDGSRGIFVGGGGSRSISDNLFFSPQLILQSQMANFKENYHFSRFLRGSNIFQGGGGGSDFFQGGGFQLLIPIEKI